MLSTPFRAGSYNPAQPDRDEKLCCTPGGYGHGKSNVYMNNIVLRENSITPTLHKRPGFTDKFHTNRYAFPAPVWLLCTTFSTIKNVPPCQNSWDPPREGEGTPPHEYAVNRQLFWMVVSVVSIVRKPDQGFDFVVKSTLTPSIA